MNDLQYFNLINNKLNNIEENEDGDETPKKERKLAQREMFYMNLKKKKDTRKQIKKENKKDNKKNKTKY